VGQDLTLPRGFDKVRWIVAGSRGFIGPEARAFLHSTLDALALLEPPSVLISGGARGADRMGELWAAEKGVCVLRILPKYNEFGPSAPLRRNTEMASRGTRLVAFWDGRSTGTAHMISQAKVKGLPVDIHLWRDRPVISGEKQDSRAAVP
jgi:hypothetical protein